MSGNWKVRFPCTRAEAEAIHDDDEWLASLDPMPTIVADEVEAFAGVLVDASDHEASPGKDMRIIGGRPDPLQCPS